MVYQQDGLVPLATVSENIALGFVTSSTSTNATSNFVSLLNLIRLEGFEQITRISFLAACGQRVELARALAGDSETLLMDEPFSSLDYLTRIRMRHELARILHERPRTVVLVTHDIEEAGTARDRVIVLTERPRRSVAS